MATVSLQSAFDAARRALDAGTADRAVAIAHYILAHYPRNIEAQRLLGEALLNAGDAEAAAEAFGQVLEADPESVAAYYGRGLAFAARDDRMAAVRSFERALEIQPNLAELRTQLIRLYGEAPGSSPQLRLSRAGLARLYTRGGMYGQAVDEFRAIEAEADRPDVEAALAEALWRDGQEDEAAAYCRQTLDRRPELLKPRLLLGYLLYAGGQPEGEELWRAGAQQDPMLSVARGLFDILPPIRLEDPLLPAFDVDELLAREYTAAQAVPTMPAEVVVEPEPSVAIATRAAEPDAELPASPEVELPASPEVEGPITLPDRPEQPSEQIDAWLANETNAASEGLEPVAPPRDMLSDDALLASLLGIDQLTEHADEQPALSPDSGLAGEQQVAAEAGEDALHARAAPSSLDNSDTEDIAPFTLQDEQIAEDDAPAHTFESGATEDSAVFQADDAGELEQFALDELAFEEDASFSAPAAADQAAPWDDPAFALGQEFRSEEADIAPFDELPDTGQASTLPGQPEATGAAAEPDATRDLFSLDDLADDAASWEQGQQISPADEEQMPFSLAELGIDADEFSVQPNSPNPIAPGEERPLPGWESNTLEHPAPPTPDLAGADQGAGTVDDAAGTPSGRQSEVGSFSLADLGLTDDEIAALDLRDVELAKEDATAPAGQAVPPQVNSRVPESTSYAAPEAPSTLGDAGSSAQPSRPEANGLRSVFQQLEADPNNPSLRLAVARLTSQSGDTGQALEQYRQLVRGGRLLDDVAGDLEDLISEGGDPQLLRRLHRLLGDTYMKQNRIEEALDQYSWTSERQ